MVFCLTLFLRGIDVVRNKIKSFAQRKVTLPDGRHKIIILDEADSSVPVTHSNFLPPGGELASSFEHELKF